MEGRDKGKCAIPGQVLLQSFSVRTSGFSVSVLGSNEDGVTYNCGGRDILYSRANRRIETKYEDFALTAELNYNEKLEVLSKHVGKNEEEWLYVQL